MKKKPPIVPAPTVSKSPNLIPKEEELRVFTADLKSLDWKKGVAASATISRIITELDKSEQKRSADQSKRAKNLRPSTYGEEIAGFVRRNKNINEKELLTALRERAGKPGSPILKVELESQDGEMRGQITWEDTKGKSRTSSVSGLKDMLTRAKKDLKK